MDNNRVRQIGHQQALIKASIENYIGRIAREFRQADKDTQLADIAFTIGSECTYIRERLETLGKLASELSSATVDSFGKNDPIVKED